MPASSSVSIADQILAAGMREAPVIENEDAASLRLAQSLESLTTEDRARLEELLTTYPLSRQVCLGVMEGSSFLTDLVRTEPARLLRCLSSAPHAHLETLLTACAAVAASSTQEGEVMRALRRMRAEAALLIALSDIGGVFDLVQVTAGLSDVADAAVRAALTFLLSDAARAGRLLPQDASDPVMGCGLGVIAMGKHGARELNYSSDIDLIIIYDRDVAPLRDDVMASPFFVKITQGLVRMLQERTGDGYVLRVDLRLRPDPGSTQVALSLNAALDYYEREGATWERAAYIKARPVAGDLKVGREYLAELSPFVWRRVLDFQAISDVHAMKREIHAFRGHDVVAVEGHNVKLGRGGIREIEFFVQTQQLIAGGRDPMLRTPRTLEALGALTAHRWIAPQVRDELTQAYLFLRRVEHRIQMLADAQTHELPEGAEAIEAFARFMGYETRDSFAAALVAHMRRVQGHYAQLFEDMPSAMPDGGLVFLEEGHDRQTLAALAQMGFKDPGAASTIVRGWLGGNHRALKGETARLHLGRFVPLLLESLARGGDPDGALIAADRFLTDLPGPNLLAALERHSDVVRLLATILTAAPRLGETLARQPSLADALLDPAFFDVLPDEEALKTHLDHLLDTAETEEEQFDRARRFRQEQHVLIGVRIASGTLPAARAGEAYARLAEVIIRALHKRVWARFREAHGTIAGAATAVLAMGKLGGREMTAGSDLDLIVLYDYDADADPNSDGPRSLIGAQYFARFTQRLISALTALTNAGKLYEVDLRLRPSGRSGPLATRLAAFSNYQKQEAWTWEHMALTRARVIAADGDFQQRVEAVIHEVMSQPRDPAVLAGDILDMRRAIAAEKGEDDKWNLKHAAGGQVDVEFIAQYLVLAYSCEYPDLVSTATARVLSQAGKLGLLKTEDAHVLTSACRLYQNLTEVLRLAVDAHVVPADASPALRALLARAGETPDFQSLSAHLFETQARVRELFTRILADHAR
ncbi:MAG: bifunctional [glutamine synthetase] adenylyltransferase/[glutamine synthetase]-adenylyl-L-tyrosine phosphorylase [Xanthobacter sp.]